MLEKLLAGTYSMSYTLTIPRERIAGPLPCMCRCIKFAVLQSGAFGVCTWVMMRMHVHFHRCRKYDSSYARACLANCYTRSRGASTLSRQFRTIDGLAHAVSKPSCITHTQPLMPKAKHQLHTAVLNTPPALHATSLLHAPPPSKGLDYVP
jgi:hypothetical protein